MRFAVVAHRRSATNVALVDAARARGVDPELLDPRRALGALEPGDVAHDKLLTARTLRLAGLPHPQTTLISPARSAPRSCPRRCPRRTASSCSS